MLFDPENRPKTLSERQRYARSEFLITIINFIAALTFIIGSFMFLSAEWEMTGTWFFIVGSFCFAVSPLLRLVRETRYLKEGNIDKLAEKFKDE